MSDSTYSVIFRGDLQPGYTVADVKANFARLFKAGPDTVEKLFSGRPLALKKGLSEAQARQLQATLSKLGAESSLRAEGEESAAARAPQPAPATQPRPDEPVVQRAPEPVHVPEAAATTEPASTTEPARSSAPLSNASLSLSPMEGNLVKEHEREQVAPVEVAVDHLSLKPAQGNLVDDSELQKKPAVNVTMPDWKLESTTSFKLPD